MRNHIKEIGKKLLLECPDNDCRIFLNEYKMLEGIEDDLVGYQHSDWGKEILHRESQRLESELDNMYYTNYAVRQYRNKYRNKQIAK